MLISYIRTGIHFGINFFTMSLTGAGLRNMKAVPNYRTVGAVCEVVDNAIQYLIDGKGTISVHFISGENNRVAHIIIADNGRGFQKDSDGREILDYCLWFGGGSNIGAESGLGKYGVGLPFSCCNQSSDYRILSWREQNRIRSVGRNHARFKDSEPVIEEVSVPTEIGNIDNRIKKTCQKLLKESPSGTIVYWKNCDNLEYVKASTLIHHIGDSLERIYRNFLNDKITIELNSWVESGNFISTRTNECRTLTPFDPLFTIPNHLTNPHYTGAPSEVYYHDIEKPLTLEHPEGVEHHFTFKASLAKEDVQHPNGRPGGNTELGRLYGRHNGISLLREGRELAMNYFGFFTQGTSDPRVRWYKGELSFSAKSDSLMGVGADKSRALAFRYTEDNHWDPEDPSSELMHKLSKRISSVLKEIHSIVDTRAKELKQRAKGVKCMECETGTVINGRCNNEACGIEVSQCKKCGGLLENDGQCMACIVKTPTMCPVHSEPYTQDGYCLKCGIPLKLTEEEKTELFNVLKIYEDFKDLSESQINNMLQWFVASGKRHFLMFLPNKLNPHELMSYKKFEHSDITFVLINKEHPFYKINIEPLLINEGGSDDFEEALESIIMLFINWARTENEMIDSSNAISLFRTRFGTNLSAAMNNWKANRIL